LTASLDALEASRRESDAHNVDHVCLRVQNYNEASILAHLAAHGVRIGEVGSRYGAEGEGPSINLFDPQG